MAFVQDHTFETLIEQLRSDKPEVRESAGRQLRSLGSSALAALETATKSSDSEVARRSGEILTLISGDLAEIERKRLITVLEKAKTTRLQFEAVWESADRDPKLRKELNGVWLIGEGAKARGVLRWKTAMNDTLHSQLVFLSDGTHWLRGNAAEPMKKAAVPPNLRRQLLSGLLDLGPAYASFLLLKELPEEKEQFNLFERLDVVERCRLVEQRAEGSKEVSYVLRESKGPPELESSLTYSRENAVFLKRRLVIYGPSGTSALITETYKQFAYNDEVPDAEFRLPDAPK